MAAAMALPNTPSADHSWLASSAREVGLVFADIVGSTALLHGQGTQIYARILNAYRRRAERVAAEEGGWIVSLEGDEIFAVFPTATKACRFGMALFEDAGDPRIAVRVGVHYGPVSRHGSGLVGRAVPTAARVMAHAAPHQMWVSDPARIALEREAQEQDPAAASFHPRWLTQEECTLDGIPGTQRLWRAG